MLLSLLNIFRADKSIEHPILGEVTCSGYHESFKKCQEIMAHKTHFSIQCHNLHEISKNCYTSQNEQEFSSWLDVRFDERKKLNKFLNENKSIMPRLQSRNMFYDIFITSVDNEVKFTDEQSQQQVQDYYKQQMNQNKGFFDDDVLFEPSSSNNNSQSKGL